MRAFVFILLISGINTFAQQADSLKELPFNPGFHRNYNPVLAHFNGEEDFQINVISDAGAGSNHLPASFINNLLFGGMIDEDQKDKAAEKLADENNAGFDFYNAVWFNTPLISTPLDSTGMQVLQNKPPTSRMADTMETSGCLTRWG